MHRGMRHRVIAVGVLAPLVATLAACSDGDKDKAKENASKSCPSNITQTAATPLPSDVPAPDGASAPYESQSQGATKFWFFAVDGSPDELVSLRDGYNDTLKGKGYDIKGTDQEEEAEAEAEFDGPHNGTTQFIPLCEGKVRVRVKLES
jgi:hypothetical protein